MSQPTSVILIAKKNHSVFLAKNEKDGLWTFPAVHDWDGSQQSLTQLTRTYFYPFIDELRLGEFSLLASPKDKIEIGGTCSHCAIFSVCIRGRFRIGTEGTFWLATKEMLVPQAMAPDIMCIVNLPEVQACL